MRWLVDLLKKHPPPRQSLDQRPIAVFIIVTKVVLRNSFATEALLQKLLQKGCIAEYFCLIFFATWVMLRKDLCNKNDVAEFFRHEDRD